MAQVYVWGKYNLNVKYEEDHSAHAPKQGDINNFWVGKSYSFSAVSGEYTLNNALEMSRENDAAQYPYAIDGAMAGDGVYYAEEAYGINKTAGWISSSGKLAYRIPDTLSGKIFYPVYYGVKTIKEKGVYIKDVTSESENTYPKDGISGSYYYVFKYVVPSVQSITVPGAAMTGQSVDIFWEAAGRAESYKLERRVDSGGWTQVYEGAELAYADTIQPGWASVQYRVSAGISGVYSTPMVSNTVSIIPTSALVISGTDGNLGTITAPVAYSVTSDPGNQITVTEIINGHERTLTPTSGQLITIPVSMLDPGTGGITIKASVQAASGIVNQTRSWTYTKTPLALPVAPYRVERMQGKECDIFPQTLAEAVFMPDGSSVAGPVIGRNVIRSYPVASGQSIQAGDVVDVVEGKVQKSATPVANVETVVNAGAVDCMAACDLNSEYAVVAEAASSGNNHDAHLISKKTGKNVSETVYFNGDTISSLALARLSDTQFVVGFASSQNVFLSVGTVSGESINLGSRYTLMALQSGWNCDICIVPFSENQAFVVTCNGSNNYPSGSILSISGSTITKGAWTHPDGVGRPGVMSAARLPDSDGKKRVCVCFNDVNDGNKGKAVIATIDSSNVVTWGSVVTIVPSDVNGTSCASVGSVIYVVFHTIVYILNDNLSVLGQEKYDTNTYSDTRLTLTSFDNFAVGTYFGKNHTDAAVIRWDGEKVSISEPYSFSPVGYANYISTARISNDRMIVAYRSAGSGNYGTTTILTVSGNQIAGSFIDGSQDAIALKSGTAGQSIEVIYSGTVAADWVTEGQVITSPGVYGAGVLAGVLQVWGRDRPQNTKMATGVFVGRQPTTSDPINNIELGFKPQYIVALSEDNSVARYAALPGLSWRWNKNDVSNKDGITITDTGFYIPNNATNPNEKYHFVAFG